MSCPTCGSPSFKTFTFSTGDTITLCPECGEESGHDVLRKSFKFKLASDVSPLWQGMLVRQGLGEHVGESNRWLELTGSYRDTDKPFTYSLQEKRARRPRNWSTSEKVLKVKEAAKARARGYKANTYRILARFGWQGNRTRSRYVGITRNETGPLVKGIAA